jgi:hypothetical protein
VNLIGGDVTFDSSNYYNRWKQELEINEALNFLFIYNNKKKDVTLVEKLKFELSKVTSPPIKFTSSYYP